MENYGTESCIRLIDVDGDGLDDIIFGLSSVDDATSGFGLNTNKWNSSEKCGNIELSRNCKASIFGSIVSQLY